MYQQNKALPRFQYFKPLGFFTAKLLPFLMMTGLFFISSLMTAQVTLIAEDAQWKYLDDGSDQDTLWKETSFDDSSWASGNAELGYGDGDESTVLSYGPDGNNKYICYYFRHTFSVSNPDATPYLNLRLLRDDGAVVYLNGKEILRSNMPFDTIDYLSTASYAASGDGETTFYQFSIQSDDLVTGNNLLAVEIHQRGAGSSDLSFNLELSTRNPVPGEIILVPRGAQWRFLDDGTNQNTAWKESGFDDSAWEEGDAELGYGDGDESSLLGYGSDGNNKYITSYFRHEFVVNDPDTTPYLLLKLLRDDGAVVYLNGTEVQRSNMPSGSIDYLTLAASSVSGTSEDTFFEYLISSDQLLEDTNVIAVEIHQRSASSSDISFNLELNTTWDVPPRYRKAPYLIYPGVNTEMMILWQLHSTFSCTLEWGTDTFYNLGNQTSTEYGTDHQHKVTLSGLANSTKYYYRVIADYDTATGNFLTGPAGNVTDVIILAYGDTRTYPADQDSVAGQIVATYTSDPDAQTLLLLSGDMVADGNSESDWDEQFFDPQYAHIQQMLRTIPLMSCMGNHEGAGLLFSKYFPYPFYNSGDYYWSFDYGPAHITILDQYTNYTEGSPQYQWLESDLSGTEKKWKIIMLHEPGWTADGGHSNNTQVQNLIQPLCEQYDVQFVIGGHNHYYARAETKRVEHITTGGGGAPLYNPDPTYPNIVKAEKAHHFCKIDIHADTLHFSVIKDNGTVIEAIDYYRHYIWTGAVSTEWRNTGNWEMDVIPTASSDILIPAGTLYSPVIIDAVSCNTLHIEDGASLDIESTGSLTVAEE
jgi:hypothetical protein